MNLFRPTVLFALLAIVAALAPCCLADTQMDVEFGWGGHLRSGRWNPVFVTASDRTPRNVVLSVQWPSGGNYSLHITQELTIGPAPETFRLLVPAHGWMSQEASFRLSDANTLKTLAHFPDYSNNQNLAGNNFEMMSSFYGISGRRTGLNQLVGAFAGLTTGYLEPRRLPESAIGFDALDVLVLNEPNLVHSTAGDDISDVQQQAIADWVRAGGKLILWPGENGFPSQGPLVDALPARASTRDALALTASDLKALGLPARFKNLAPYRLEPRAGAEKIPLLNAGQVNAYGWRFGLGRVVLAPLNMADVTADRLEQAVASWRPMRDSAGLDDKSADANLPATKPAQVGYQMNPDQEQSQRQSAASMQIADFLGDVPGAGSISFSYVAIVLIGLMVVVGPVDWFVLKKLGRQPWTWVTTTGWIVLITAGAVFTGHLLKSGDLTYRTLRAVDQVGDATIATTDYIALYSPRTQTYEIRTAPNETSPDSWWQPAGVTDNGGSELKLDVDFHQTSQSNTPDDMLVNVWSLRFLRGDRIVSGPPMISADLKFEAGRVFGSIVNLTDMPLKNLRVKAPTGSGDFAILSLSAPATAPSATMPSTAPASLSQIPPHGVAKVEVFIRPDSPEPAADANPYYAYQNPKTLTEAEIPTAAFDLNIVRSQKLLDLMKSGKFAIVYAEAVNPPAAAELMAAKESEHHWQFIRALVELH